MPRKEKFWSFRNVAENEVELLLYGNISQRSWWGDEATPRKFAEDLSNVGALDKITVRINSGGGDVFAAQAIGNMLEQHPADVTAKIDGMCASAATIVACHCNKVVAANDSTYMIHPVQMGICDYVDAATLGKYIEALDVIRENILSLYVKKTGRDKDEVAALMDAETWWTGPDAKDNGFVDELTDDEPAAVENRNGLLFINGVNLELPFDQAPESLQSRGMKPGFVNKSPAQPGPNHKEENDMAEIKTVDDLQAAYPDLANQISERATNAERQRIQDIEEMSMPGDEDFANEAKYTKPVSADVYARDAMKRVKAMGEQHFADAKDDAADAGNVKNVDDGVDEFIAAIQRAAK